MNEPLYKLTESFLEFKDAMSDIDPDQLDDESFQDALNGISNCLDEKIENCIAMALNLESEAAGVEEAICRMSLRKRALDKKVKWLRNYIMVNLDLLDIDEFKTDEWVCKRRRNPQKVTVNDMELIDDEYIEVKISRTPNKKKIAAALKDGKNVMGATLDTTYRLEIK